MCTLYTKRDKKQRITLTAQLTSITFAIIQQGKKKVIKYLFTDTTRGS